MNGWFDRIITGGILFLVLFGPLAFGSVHPWAFSVMEALLFLLVAVWMAKLLFIASSQMSGVRSSGYLPPPASRFTPKLILPLALFVTLMLFQLLPLPPSFLRLVSPQTYQLYTQSLPGWPQKIPYADLLLQKPRADTGPAVLPTLDEVRSGAPIPFSEFSRSPLAPNASRLPPSASPLPAPRSRPSEVSDSPSAIGHSPFATWFPLSIAPALSRTDLLKFTAYAALFFLVLLYPFGDSPSAIRHPPSATSHLLPQDARFIRSVLLVVLLAGLLVAATGFIQRFSWNGKILWFFVPYDWGTPIPSEAPRSSGPFINPDHFANYLSLIFPLALACALFRTSILSRHLEEGFRIFCAFAAFLLFTGILLSLSRSGWISALLGVSILLWVSPWKGASGEQGAVSREQESIRNSQSAIRNQIVPRPNRVSVPRAALIILCFLLVASLFFVGPGGREQVDTRLGETVTQDAGLWGRTTIWKDSLGMIRDFPLFGVGLGSWPELFPRYRRAPWSAVFYREAHNDYLELLAETGMIGFGLLAWFFYQGGSRLFRGLKEVSPKALPLMAAILAALGVMAFHELLDFNLQIPANAFLFILLFALALRMTASAVNGQPSAISYPRFISRFPAFLAASLGVVALVFAVVALRQEQIPYPHNLKQPVSIAEAKELLLSHPARALSHFSLLRLLENKAPLSLQLSESGAALWLEPTNPHIRGLRASILLRMGRTDEGLKEITRSVLDSPTFSTHFYLSGKLLPWLSAAEQKAVEEGLRQALGRAYPEAIASLAEFYARLGRFSDQAMLYERVALRVNEGPNRTDYLLSAGMAYAKAQDATKAERLLRSAITTNPTDPRAYHQLLTMLYGPRKDLSGANEVVSEGIKNGVAPFSLYLSLAEAAQKAGSPGESKAALSSAKTEVDRAARTGRDPYPLYLLLANAAGKAGDRVEEKAALLEALDLRPRSSNTLFRLANLYLQEQDFDRAALYFSKIANINPNSADVYFHLAVAEEGRYGFTAADKAYARAVELAPDNKGFQSRYDELKRKVAQNRKDDATR